MTRLMLALILILLAGIVLASSEGRNTPICRAVQTTPLDDRLSVAVWGDYPEGWIHAPDDLFDRDPIILYMDATQQAGYVLYIVNDKLWVFPHWSFESRFGAAGTHGGTHDLCDVLIYTLEK
jgi:hypothetical protein